MERPEILNWLRETDGRRLEALWRQADAVRREQVGDAVHLRGLIEISSFCVRQCGYCGIRAGRVGLDRYRMTPDEILDCARSAARFGYGTVVVQAGEDPQLTPEWVAGVVRRIKAECPLAVTLSLGEQDEATLRAWKEAGADRYLLRFETSNPRLFASIHPPRTGRSIDRISQLHSLRELGYEVGSGVMIGIPGQTYDDLADDVELFRTLDLDMIGVGPFLPHPETPLGQLQEEGTKARRHEGTEGDGEQVPNTELMTYKVVALARLVCPCANIPSTTALATLNRESGRELGLVRGANIIMPNLTPPEYRARYEIYPAKACLYETAEQCHHCIRGRIVALGRTVGTGHGGSPNWRARVAGDQEPAPGGDHKET